MTSHNSRVIFVTGGASGIGREIVLAFIEAGERVCFCDSDSDKGEKLASESGARFFHLDVKNADSLESAMDDIVEQFGDIDIVVNNVGVSEFTPLAEISTDDFDRVIATNLRPAFITSRYIARLHNTDEGRSKFGAIVNIASTRYLQSEQGSEAYAASKGGIVSLTHALALSFSEYNISVNSIAPGWIDNDNSYDKFTEEDHKQHPSGRVGKCADIARVALFLCDERNNFINGENIVVDGGMTKKMIYTE